MLKNTKYIALGICALPLIIMLGTWLQMRPTPPQTAEEVERLINAELPSEASKSQVEAFLDAHRITRSGYENKYQTDPELETDFKDKKFEGKTHRIKHYIFASTPNRARRTLFRSDINITFYFDSADNLVDYLIREVEDGP